MSSAGTSRRRAKATVARTWYDHPSRTWRSFFLLRLREIAQGDVSPARVSSLWEWGAALVTGSVRAQRCLLRPRHHQPAQPGSPGPLPQRTASTEPGRGVRLLTDLFTLVCMGAKSETALSFSTGSSGVMGGWGGDEAPFRLPRMEAGGGVSDVGEPTAASADRSGAASALANAVMCLRWSERRRKGRKLVSSTRESTRYLVRVPSWTTHCSFTKSSSSSLDLVLPSGGGLGDPAFVSCVAMVGVRVRVSRWSLARRGEVGSPLDPPRASGGSRGIVCELQRSPTTPPQSPPSPLFPTHPYPSPCPPRTTRRPRRRGSRSSLARTPRPPSRRSARRPSSLKSRNELATARTAPVTLPHVADPLSRHHFALVSSSLPRSPLPRSRRRTRRPRRTRLGMSRWPTPLRPLPRSPPRLGRTRRRRRTSSTFLSRRSHPSLLLWPARSCQRSCSRPSRRVSSSSLPRLGLPDQLEPCSLDIGATVQSYLHALAASLWLLVQPSCLCRAGTRRARS